MSGAPGTALSEDIVQDMAKWLLLDGVPLDEAVVFVRTLHPSVDGRQFTWRKGQPVEVAEVMYGDLVTGNYRDTPYAQVVSSREGSRLTGNPDATGGFTDAIYQALPFLNGETHVAAWFTRHAQGFDDISVQVLEAVRQPVARIAEIMALRRTAHNLLDTYLGRGTGGRVLSGAIHRGDGDDIRAVIWFCDLRNSTPLAEALGRRRFLTLLNDYLECLGGAVIVNGGEILRFIGDAALAIFPIADEKTGGYSVQEACTRAVKAAHDAMQRMAALNVRYRESGREPVGFGIGLHVGEVMYGNIGASNRLEFTVIGAAANEAARIEAQCKVHGVSLIVSDGVAKVVPHEWRSLGPHKLAGVGRELELFTVAEPGTC
ncbi:MAG: adenylate/guanylate cyclase domain-containing protein [Gammaproteobacteria bacterium]